VCYLQKFQAIADQLRSIGSDVSKQDLVLFSLQGLGSEYESFVTAISMRPGNLTMEELHDLLHIIWDYLEISDNSSLTVFTLSALFLTKYSFHHSRIQYQFRITSTWTELQSSSSCCSVSSVSRKRKKKTVSSRKRQGTILYDS
jgi:gag-polypeptide of LTR copia-type